MKDRELSLRARIAQSAFCKGPGTYGATAHRLRHTEIRREHRAYALREAFGPLTSMLFAALFFLLAFLGLAGLFGLKYWELKSGRVLFASARERADARASHLKELL